MAKCFNANVATAFLRYRVILQYEHDILDNKFQPRSTHTLSQQQLNLPISLLQPFGPLNSRISISNIAASIC